MFMKDRLTQIIQEEIAEFAKEGNQLVDFDTFPPEIKKTYEDEYFQYPPDWSNTWNDKQDEFRIKSDNPQGFQDWYEKVKSEQFLKTLDDVIRKTTQDMILLKRRNVTEMKLKAFEELIIPVLGDEVLSQRLTKYQEDVLMDQYATPESIAQGFKDAKHMVGDDLDTSLAKSEMSDIFLGGDINIPAFERYIKKHPEKQKTYDAWKKIFDEEMELTLRNLNAFRDTTSIERIRDLRNFLINYKKNIK